MNEELRTYLCQKYTKSYEEMSKDLQHKIDEMVRLVSPFITQHTEAARFDERKRVALDNYHGHTFSDSTNWRGKFEKFIQNNERRISQLQSHTNKPNEGENCE